MVSHLMHQQAMRIINKEVDAATAELSPRERETLTQLSLGQSRAEVADALQISENTLRAYIDFGAPQARRAERDPRGGAGAGQGDHRAHGGVA